MKHFVITVTLTFMLSATALAGDIPTGGIAPPPAPDSAPSGQIPSDGTSLQISDAAMNLIQTLLGLL